MRKWSEGDGDVLGLGLVLDGLGLGLVLDGLGLGLVLDGLGLGLVLEGVGLGEVVDGDGVAEALADALALGLAVALAAALDDALPLGLGVALALLTDAVPISKIPASPARKIRIPEITPNARVAARRLLIDTPSPPWPPRCHGDHVNAASIPR